MQFDVCPFHEYAVNVHVLLKMVLNAGDICVRRGRGTIAGPFARATNAKQAKQHNFHYENMNFYYRKNICIL